MNNAQLKGMRMIAEAMVPKEQYVVALRMTTVANPSAYVVLSVHTELNTALAEARRFNAEHKQKPFTAPGWTSKGEDMELLPVALVESRYF